MKHRYGIFGVHVPNTAGVRILHGYQCLRTPVVRVQIRYRSRLNEAELRCDLTLSLDSLSITSSLYQRRSTVCPDLDLRRGKISEVLRSEISVATEKPRRCLQACDVFAEKPKAVENMKIQGANKTSAMLLILGISVGRDKLLILGIGKGRDKMVKKSKVMSGCYKRCIIFLTLFFLIKAVEIY